MSRPRREIRLLRIAEDDLAEVFAYLVEESSSGAERQLARIERALRRLVKNPYLGKLPKDDHLMQMGYRSLVIDEYLAFYTIEDESILVHRIIHGARDYLSFLH